MFLIGMAAAFTILPSNCSLLGNDPGPYFCHTLPTPDYCCTDFKSVPIAQVTAVLTTALSLGMILSATLSSVFQEHVPTIKANK